jgi:MFS family permease
VAGILQALPGGRRRAVPLAASSLFVTAAAGGLGLVVQLYLKSIGTPVFFIGLVSTVNSAGLLLGSWLWGGVADRFNRRVLLMIFVAGLTLAISSLVFLPGVGVVLPTEFVRAVMLAGVSTVSVAVVSAASRVERRGKNLSYISSARALGFAAGNVVAGVVLDRLGFRPAFILLALLPIAGFLFIWLLPKENPVERREKMGAWKAILHSGLLDLYVATALRQMAMFGTFALLYVYMESLGISISLMGVISATNTATQVVAVLVFGWLADRVGRRRVFLLGFFTSATVPLFFVLTTTVVGMVAGYVMLAISFSSLYVGAAAIIGDSVPPHRHGQMLGLYDSSRGLGGLFGPILAGALVPLIGFEGMFAVMACIGGLGFIVMIFGKTVLGTRVIGN